MTGLGYVTIGYALDDKVAREVSEAAAAEVVFVADGRIVAGTLPQALRQKLASSQGELLRRSIQSEEMELGGERYLASSVQLQPESPTGAVQLVVFKSFGEEQKILASLNRMVIILGFLRPCSAWAGRLHHPHCHPAAGIAGGCHARAERRRFFP